MQKVTNIEDLRSTIKRLEDQQSSEWILLKRQFLSVHESLRPINIIKNTFKEVISSPSIKANIVDTLIGFASGFVVKKVLIGNSNNPLTKILGFFTEITVANKVTQNADQLKTIGSILLNKILNRYVRTTDSKKDILY